jgi:anti-sigma regulatory factor (Ser/Thr protein kinase)
MSTMTLTRPIRPPEPQSPRVESPGLRSPELRSPELRSPELRSHCIRLASGPAAVPAARRQVQAAIRAWAVPADPADVALLTSELVTNAVRHAAGPVVTLVVSCSPGQVRVDVHDTSSVLPATADVPADAESGRGLHLVASLAREWGFYRTPAGKAVYFTLAFGPDPAPGVGERHLAGDGEP